MSEGTPGLLKHRPMLGTLGDVLDDCEAMLHYLEDRKELALVPPYAEEAQVDTVAMAGAIVLATALAELDGTWNIWGQGILQGSSFWEKLQLCTIELLKQEGGKKQDN